MLTISTTRAEHPFGEDDLRIVAAFADLAALALERAELLDREERRTQVELLLNEAAHEVTRSLDQGWSVDDQRVWYEASQGSRLIPTLANGLPAFGQYKPTVDGAGHEPWALQVVEMSGDRITGITFFLDTARFFPIFSLPPRLDD